MGKKVYVGNLSYEVTDSDLNQLFEPHGTVLSSQVIMDPDTGPSKGFGFVEMASEAEAQAAISGLNETEHEGRPLTVNEAKPRENRGGYGGGRGGGAAADEAIGAAGTKSMGTRCSPQRTACKTAGPVYRMRGS